MGRDEQTLGAAMDRDEERRRRPLHGWSYWAGIGLRSLGQTAMLLWMGNGLYQIVFRHDVAASVFAFTQAAIFGLLIMYFKLNARLHRLETEGLRLRVGVTLEPMPTLGGDTFGKSKPAVGGPN